MVNLRTALEKATLEAKTINDFNRIKSLLKVPILKEIARTDAPSKDLIYMELAENVASSAKDTKQIEDIKLYLKTIISAKEKERGGFSSFLDKLNTALFGPTVTLSMPELEAKEKKLIARIARTKQKEPLQRLYYDLGNVYLQMSDLPKTEEAFLRAIDIDPTSDLATKAKFNLAWSYKHAGEYDKAVSQFRDLAKEHPKNELAIKSQYEAADALYKKGDYQQAKDSYVDLAGQHPGSSESDIALFQAGYVSYFNLNDTDSAVKYFSELENEFPQNVIAKHTKEKTRKIMASEYNRAGYMLLRAKDYLKAIENFDKALGIAPDYGRSMAGKGLASYWLGDKAEALSQARRAMEISMDDEVAVINALFIFINCKEIDEAIRVGEQALAGKAMERSEFYYNLGYAYVIKANIDKAYREFGRSIKLNPDFIFAYNNLGCSFWVERKYSDAVNKFREAIDRGEDYAEAHFNLGVAYFYLNQLEDAAKEFKRVLVIKPGYQEAQDFLDKIKETLKYEP